MQEVIELLKEKTQGNPLNTLKSAELLDKNDELLKFRNEFNIPTLKSIGTVDLNNTNNKNELDSNKPSIYFCGNSLGLMPKNTLNAINLELKEWSNKGVNAHFDGRILENNSQEQISQVKEPWVSIDKPCKSHIVDLVGGKYESEVAVMNTLTSNLHLALLAFYHPEKFNANSNDGNKRYKIMFEKKAFPSDYYAFESQVRLHGYDPSDALVMLSPRKGEYLLRTDDILDAIEKEGNSLAIVCLPGVQFYTGQAFDIKKITSAGHKVGAYVGWDLAHAIGNIVLNLHEDNVDFAVWCSYKYLNAGPGGIAGLFIHSKYENETLKERPRLAGWWGNDPETRFQMNDNDNDNDNDNGKGNFTGFKPAIGANGFQLSNPSVLDMVCLRSSLELFTKAGGIQATRKKSILLTGYLYELLTSSKHFTNLQNIKSSSNNDILNKFSILTPNDPNQRGAQLSLIFPSSIVMHLVFAQLGAKGITGDERQPDVIRLSPAPLYNTFSEVFTVAAVLEEILNGF